jgi:hypothetical protein
MAFIPQEVQIVTSRWQKKADTTFVGCHYMKGQPLIKLLCEYILLFYRIYRRASVEDLKAAVC